MRSQKCYNSVNLHKMALLSSQVHGLILFQLLQDSLWKLTPVKIAYQLFELGLVEVVSVLKCVNVDFYQVVVGKPLWQAESGLFQIFNRVKPVVERVKSVQFLNQESSSITRIRVLALRQRDWTKKRLYRIVEQLLFEQRLTLVEEQFIHWFMCGFTSSQWVETSFNFGCLR